MKRTTISGERKISFNNNQKKLPAFKNKNKHLKRRNFFVKYNILQKGYDVVLWTKDVLFKIDDKCFVDSDFNVDVTFNVIFPVG